MNTITQYLPLLGAVVAIATGVHSAALVVGKFWPPALKVAEISGVIAVDVQEILSGFSGARK